MFYRMSRKMSHLLRPPHSFVLQWHFIQNWHPMLRKWKHLAKTTNGRFDVLPLQRSRNSSGDPNHQNSHGRFGRAACPPSTVALKGTCLYRLVAWKHLNKQNPPGGSPTKFPHLGIQRFPIPELRITPLVKTVNTDAHVVNLGNWEFDHFLIEQRPRGSPIDYDWFTDCIWLHDSVSVPFALSSVCQRLCRLSRLCCYFFQCSCHTSLGNAPFAGANLCIVADHVGF